MDETKFQLLEVDDSNDIGLAHAILIECGKTMYEQFNLSHWYPFMDLETFTNTVKNKKLYSIYHEREIIATFNLSIHARDYYQESFWSNANEKAVYLGQLGIHPNFQNGGIGLWCMKQIEKISLMMHCKAIRFDGVSDHPYLKKFYEKCGYSSCCTVKPGKWELTCFEKVIA